MAESNQRKIADPIDLTEEDPFAELTRIMGFDPRLASRPQTSEVPPPAGATQTARAQIAPVGARSTAAEPRPVVAAPAESSAYDDFGIDLEKELMGAFADIEPEQPSFVSPLATQPAEPVDVATDSDFDDAFAASLEEVQPSAVREMVVMEPAAAIEPLRAEPVFAEPESGHPYADAYEADAPAAEFELELESDLDLAAELDLATELELAPEPESAPALHVDPQPRPDPDPEFDLGPEFQLDDLDFSEPLPEQGPYETAAAMGEGAPAAGFDDAPVAEAPVVDALAEVDMDFIGAFDEALPESEALTDSEEADHAASQWPDPVPGPVYRDREAAPSESEDPLDLSLEDELGALLNAYPQPVEYDPAPVADLANEPARQAFEPEDSRWAALEAEDEAHGAAAGPAASSPAAPDWRRTFADPALIARHANFKLAAAPAVEKPHEDLDALLDAMESEVHAPDPAPAMSEASDGDIGALALEHAEAAYLADAAFVGAGPLAACDHHDVAWTGDDAAPDIETVDVPENAVAMADDLDIPELAYEEDLPAVSRYDDIDTDYAASYGEAGANAEPESEAPRGVQRAGERLDIDSGFESLYRTSGAYPAASGQATATYADAQSAPVNYAYDAPAADYDAIGSTDYPPTANRDRFVDLDFDSDVEEELPLPAYAPRQAVAAPRRGLLIAAVVGGVAVLGGIAAFALTFGAGPAGNMPVLVKADDGPVKVKPEKPGGTTVPDQDNKVYDAVKGTGGSNLPPAQEKLVTASEEPVDMDTVDGVAAALPGLADEEDVIPKAEDRVDPAIDGDQSTNAPEGVVVTPRKVKTMVVRSDGTLVAREDVAPAAAAETTTGAVEAQPLQPTDAAPLQPAKTEAAPPDSDQTAAVETEQPTFQSPGGEDPVPVKTVKTRKVAAANPVATVPEAGPVTESRPADQPVDAVGEVKPEELASANVEPAAISAGTWSVQIASQPSEASAKSNYDDLARRYRGVIGGRGVNIVKADIAGKGTYWRVRVPAKSRDDAISLCTDYKAAGGNCFVSK